MNSLKHNNNRFMSLLVISLATHLCVLFAIHFFNTNKLHAAIIPPYQDNSVFFATIKEIKPALKKTEQQQVLKSPNKNIKTIKRQETEKIISNNAAKNNHTDTQATSSQQYSALLIKQIKSDVSHHFNYPSFARRKGWQGQVLLEFNISDTGIINNIEIRSSSGYEILDNAAQESLSRVHHIKIARNMELPSSLRLQIPIIYQLTKG